MTVGSLFSGVGGIDLGFQRAGFEIAWQVEIDPWARRVLAKHWPDVKRHDDVRTFCRMASDMKECSHGCDELWCEICEAHFFECQCVGISEFGDEWGSVDVIVGGDPCQENSNARRSAETINPSLGAEFIRIVDRLRPRFVVRENPATVRADAPWPWWRFRNELERLNYAVLPFRLRACCAGADFRRDRLFLLAELQSAECKGLEGNVGEVLARAEGRRHDSDSAGPNKWSASPRICGRTVRVPHRVDRLRGLGNAVVPQVAQLIAQRIKDST